MNLSVFLFLSLVVNFSFSFFVFLYFSPFYYMFAYIIYLLCQRHEHLHDGSVCVLNPRGSPSRTGTSISYQSPFALNDLKRMVYYPFLMQQHQQARAPARRNGAPGRAPHALAQTRADGALASTLA
jgi:hypothetical protein